MAFALKVLVSMISAPASTVVQLSQLSVLPRVFRSEIPEEFASELRKAKTDDEAAEIGIEAGHCTL